MSDNGFVRLDRLKTALSRVKTKVDSDIASAISESTISLTSVINSGDASTLSEAKGYADGLKIIIDSNINSGDSSTLTSANSYTDSKISSVNSTINDLSESIPEQIDLALENYTEYSDFSDHISNTNNPHNVTAVQVGAAAISHTHTESDITDLGSYASSSHTHTLNDITDSDTLATNLNLTTHTSNTNNPHQVTKSQVGLSNVDNTSDLNKPISTAVQTALDDLEDRIDAIDEIGSSITLASLGGASATDLTNHINDTNNPHSVTYTQTGAAAASHTHELTDVTDITATATEVNYLTNSSRNIQMQLNDARMCGFFPAWEYNKEYHCEDVVKTPGCKPLQYLECIVDGTSGYVQKATLVYDDQTINDLEYYVIPVKDYGHNFTKGTETITNSSVKISDLSDFNAGDTIIDGTTAWIVQDLRDGRLIGEITCTTHWLNTSNANNTMYNYNNYQYGLDLRGCTYLGDSTRSRTMLYEGTQHAHIDNQIFKIKFIRLLKYIINTSLLLNQTGKTSNNNPARLFNLVCGPSLLLKNGNTFSNSFAGSNLGTHCVGGIILMDWCLHPFDYLSNDRVNIIDENVFKYMDIDTFQREYSYTKTKNDYVTQAIVVKNQMKTYGIDWDNDNSLYCDMTRLDSRYLRFGHYGKMVDPGLPNLKGTIQYITSKNMNSSTRTTNLNSTEAIKWLKSSNNNEVLSVTSGNSSNLGCWDIDLNASRYNSIYGNSTTVTPNTLDVEMMMKF